MSSTGRPIPGCLMMTFIPSRMARTPRLAVPKFFRQEIVRDAVDPAAPLASRSDVTCRWRNILTRLQLGHPSIGLFMRHMQAICLIVVPSSKPILAHQFALFFASNILADRLKNHPVGASMAGIGQALNPLFSSVSILMVVGRKAAAVIWNHSGDTLCYQTIHHSVA